MHYDLVTDSPIGKIGVQMDGQIPRRLVMRPEDSTNRVPTEYHWVADWLENYFADASSWRPLQTAMQGTPYQQRVWQALNCLDVGETMTYGELARKLDSGPRAIGQACRTNPCPLFVPCHRIVAASGRGGFAGAASGEWPAIKAWLLQHEGVLL